MTGLFGAFKNIIWWRQRLWPFAYIGPFHEIVLDCSPKEKTIDGSITQEIILDCSPKEVTA